MIYPWAKMNVLPKADLLFWHQYEEGVSANGALYDYSGNGRHVVQASTPPTLTANVLNGQPAWRFTGSTNPLQWTGSILCKHAFIVCSADEAAFGDYRGLLSGVGLNEMLVGQIGADQFFDFGATTYRKADVSYPGSSAKAPMSGAIAVIEIIYSGGAAMDGVQYGKHKNLPGRNWLGYIFEGIGYGAVKNDFERLKIIQYLAMRYWLWQRTPSGLDVFPFPANVTRSAAMTRESYASEPYSGDPTFLVRGDAHRAFTIPATNRLQAEYLATEQFHMSHAPATSFVYRDYRFNPPRDSTCRVIGDLREQGSAVTGRFNYSFDAIEV